VGESPFRERPEDPVDAMLDRAELFVAYGDDETVGRCLGLAENLALGEGNTEALARVRAFADRLAARCGRAREAGSG
jgi:hypothetical protein